MANGPLHDATALQVTTPHAGYLSISSLPIYPLILAQHILQWLKGSVNSWASDTFKFEFLKYAS